MANVKSSTPGSTNAPGAAVSSTPLGSSTPPAGGTSSGANVSGTGPATAIKPPAGFQKTIQQLVAGTVKDIPTSSSIVIGGTQVSQAQILAILQPALDAFTAVSEAKAQAKKSIASAKLALTALLPGTRTFAGNLKAALIAFFGKGNPLLADFGIKDGTLKKKPTVAEKAVAKVKASKTRELRKPLTKAETQALKFQGQVQPASAVEPSGGSSTPPGSTPAGNGGTPGTSTPGNGK